MISQRLVRRVATQGWTDGGLADHNGTLEVPESRVFSVKTDGSQLIIRQSVQTRSREYDQDTEGAIEVRYFLSPYNLGICGQGTG